MTSAVKNIDLFTIASSLFQDRKVPGPNADRLFCRFGCNEPAYACGGVGVVEDASTAQNVRAGLCPGAEMVLASCILNIQRQLVGGNRSRAENSGGHPH
jgi:hypothetical protein